jgi:hypothetical protein
VFHFGVPRAGSVALDPDEVTEWAEPDFLPRRQEPRQLRPAVKADTVAVGFHNAVDFGERGEYPAAVIVVGEAPAAPVRVTDKVGRVGQPDGDRVTGELTWAEFLHLTARPEGKLPDPHLHVHCFTFNATFDPVEKAWKAAQFREIMRKAPYYQAAFMTRLSNNLMAIGYDIRPAGNAFEIVGVPDAVLKQFSKRTAKIKDTAEKLGIKDPKLLDKLGALTRKAKRSDLTFGELRGLWRTEVSEEHRAALDRFLRPRLARQLGEADRRKVLEAESISTVAQEGVPPKRKKVSKTPMPQSALTLLEKSAPSPRTTGDAPKGRASPEDRLALQLGEQGCQKVTLGPKAALVLWGQGAMPPRPPTSPANPSLERVALDRSILHNFYRASVVTEADILTHAMRLAYGSGLTPEGLRAAMKQHSEFIFGEINGRKLVTTHSVLAEERENIRWVKEGMGNLPPMIATYMIREQKLNEEQQAAVLHVLSSRDRVTAIEGKSGTGKTWLMREAVSALEAAGHRVLVMAPSTHAVQETLKKGGFPAAETVEQLLVNEKLQEQYRNGIWWVDEAGMLSGRSMSRLFALAEKLNARIVTTGDVGQHRAIERGDALRMLYDYAELQPVRVTKIMRQTGDYRDWMELLAQGKVLEAFEKMDAGGVIHEIPEHRRYKETGELYAMLTLQGHRPGVVAPTHLEGRMMTEGIRAALKAQGKLPEDTPVPQLRQIDMSPADQANWRSYRPGWVIEYIRATPGSAAGPGTPAGTRHEIDYIDYDQGEVYVKVEEGAGRTATRRLDLEKDADRFAVYEANELAIAPGERVLITKNGPAGNGRVSRGSEHTFVGFDEHGDLKLDNGKVLQRDFAHLAYGYYSTSIAAQSKTVDHVIVMESAVSFAAASREQIYVSAGRGKIRLDIVTNNKVELLEAVIATYCLLAIARKRLGLEHDMHQITQILRLHLFSKTPIFSLFSTDALESQNEDNANHLSLFE